MFNRENWVGIVLVGMCGVVAVALLIEIFTGYTFEYSGPQWLARIIALGGTGLVLVMSFAALKRRFGRRGGPGTSRGGPSWPQNDLPTQMNWPRSNNTPGASEPPKNDPAPKSEEEKQVLPTKNP